MRQRAHQIRVRQQTETMRRESATELEFRCSKDKASKYHHKSGNLICRECPIGLKKLTVIATTVPNDLIEKCIERFAGVRPAEHHPGNDSVLLVISRSDFSSAASYKNSRVLAQTG